MKRSYVLGLLHKSTKLLHNRTYTRLKCYYLVVQSLLLYTHKEGIF